MSVTIPENLLDLFQKPIVCGLATLMPNGQPQVTPIWFLYDGTHIIINTARGRQKDRNLTHRAKTTVLVIDPQNPYHWAEVRGYVDVATEEGARDVINQLSHKYTGQDFVLRNPDEARVTYKIALEKVNGQ